MSKYEDSRYRSRSDEASDEGAGSVSSGSKKRISYSDQMRSSNRSSYDRSNYRARNRNAADGDAGHSDNSARQARSRNRSTASGSSRSSRDSYSHRDGRSASRASRGDESGKEIAKSSRREQRNETRHDGGSRSKLLPILIVLLIVLGIGIGFAVTHLSPSGEPSATGNTTITATSAQEQAASLPTPYIAEGSGVLLHSAVEVHDLTEILIHNASYSYACELSTQLTEATNNDVMAAHGTGRNADEQPAGNEWLTGEFIRCFRSGNAGPKMSAIDCGGSTGATVYAPVSGTVVRVKDYSLYGNEAYPDIQIHIQPEGRSDIDVVLIHLTDPTVKEGDVVEGGVTPIASIRDVYAYIGEEMQLKNYTAEGDNGNHTHIQINDATNKEYHGLD